MFFARQVCLLAILAALAVPPPSYAGTDWPPIDPAEWQIKDLPAQPGATAFILFREEIDDDLQHTISVYKRIKVLNEAGRKYADIEIPYLTYRGMRLTVHNIQARTIHTDGSIIVFQGKPYDKTVVKSKAIKEQIKTFSLPDVQVGSILEFRYVLRYDYNFVLPPQWDIQDELFVRKEHFSFTYNPTDVSTAHGAIGQGVSYTSNLPGGKHIEENNKGIFDLQLSDVPAFVEEEHMPPGQLFRYYVWFYYGRGTDVSEYWKDEGGYWRRDVERFMKKAPAVAEAVAKVINAGDTPEQKAKKIYAFVQTLDNSTYQPKRSDKELKALHIKDRNVADILRQQGGDQQELTLLYVAMARVAGLQAYPMWVTDRSRDFFERKFLSLDQLDAYVAVISLDGKNVYLDPGTRFCPYGLIYWPHANAGGLKETDNGTELSFTPLPQYKDAETKRVARLTLSDDGTLQGMVGVGYFGQKAISMRIDGSKTDDVGRNTILEAEMKSWLPSNAEVAVTRQPDWNNSSTPFVVNFKISTPVLVSGGSNRFLLPTNIFQFSQPAMFVHNEREYPIYFDYPSCEIDDIRIQLSGGLQVENLPSSETSQLKFALSNVGRKQEKNERVYASYKVERKQDKNELVINREFVIDEFSFLTIQYGNLKAFYDKMQESDQQQALLKQVAHVAQN